MYQITVEELYKKVVIEKQPPHRALRETTLTIPKSDYYYYFEALSLAHEDAVNYSLNKQTEMRLFIHYVIEFYNGYFLKDQLDMDNFENDQYGYYNLEDGSEYRKGRISLNELMAATDWDILINK